MPPVALSVLQMAAEIVVVSIPSSITTICPC